MISVKKPTDTPHVSQLWKALQAEAVELLQEEPMLFNYVEPVIVKSNTVREALIKLLVPRLCCHYMREQDLASIFHELYEKYPALGPAARMDLLSIRKYDPAAKNLVLPFLFFKGFHALQTHRVAHILWQEGRHYMALYLQNRASDIFGVDIHPAARFGNGVTLDHATGIVIGETSVIGDDVLILHGVTLGAKAYSTGDRHPKVGNSVKIGAGVSVLGNIHIGNNAVLASGSVVLDDVLAGTTVAGVPAKTIKK
ncbi:MAG: serine O-acetyltransferase [Alphaproteobacteria bacterium]|nr:serine O-acetyltransferase [Alphaproteobacteria bacterium]